MTSLLDALLPDGCLGSRDCMDDTRVRICNRDDRMCDHPPDEPTHACPRAHGMDYDHINELRRDAREEVGDDPSI